MDILRDGQADCFCLVASDGDYSLPVPKNIHRIYDIAKLLNVSLRTVARYREKGLIRYYQTDENGKNFYSSSDIQDFLQKRGKKN